MFLTSNRCVPQYQTAMVALFLVVSCGDSGPAEIPGADEPGYIIECQPGESDPQKVCMDPNDYNCPYFGDYTREALCAYAYGGTPADYDNKPVMVPATGDSAYEDCANFPEVNHGVPHTHSVWGVVPSQDFGPPEDWNVCSDCTVCDLQHQGAQKWGTGWDELNSSHCPNNEFLDYCGVEAEPTGGAEDEGGDEGAAEVLWVCNGSNTLTGCLVGVMSCGPGGGTSLGNQLANICVWSAPGDEPAARAGCNDYCEEFNDFYDLMGDWNPEFACGSFGDEVNEELPGFTPAEVPPGFEYTVCSAFPSQQAKPFMGEASMLVYDGTTPVAAVRLNNWAGLIDFSIVGSCSNSAAICDVMITEIYALSSLVEGEYDDGSVLTLPVTIDDPHIRLMQPVVGVLYPLTGQLSFPNHDFFLEVSTGPTELDSTQVNAGIDKFVAFIDDPTGSYSYSTGEVELSLTWNVANIELAVDLATW